MLLYVTIPGIPKSNVRVVTSLKAASEAFCAARDKYELGASDLKKSDGSVINDDLMLVARISYNGRIWAPDGEEIKT